MNILAIEDDLVDQMALRRLFAREQSLGVLTVVNSVFEARREIRNREFEAILLDYHLGQETGFDVLEFIGDLPVIFLTGSSSIELAVKAIKAGAYDFLVKDTGGKHLAILPATLRAAIVRKQVERELHESRKRIQQLEAENLRIQMIERMVSEISHDIRTPITVLQNSIYLLRRELEKLYATLDPTTLQAQHMSVEKIEYHLDYISKPTQRIQNMLLRMLEMARLNEKPELQWAQIDLNELCEDALDIAQPLFQEHKFALRLAANLPEIRGDSLELSSVITNLIENAIKYTYPGGQITVTTRYDAECVLLEVADSGIGIAPEHLSHIFERFYRTDKSRNMATGGFGLGLAKVKRVVELHSGGVEVQSTPDVGTTFTVMLPRWMPD